MSDEPRGRLRRVGAMWKPRPGGKSLGSGSVTINGLRQRFVIFANDRKQGDRDPDYVLLAGDEPERDEYAQRAATASSAAAQPAGTTRPANRGRHFADPVAALDDDIPF